MVKVKLLEMNIGMDLTEGRKDAMNRRMAAAAAMTTGVAMPGVEAEACVSVELQGVGGE